MKKVGLGRGGGASKAFKPPFAPRDEEGEGLSNKNNTVNMISRKVFQGNNNRSGGGGVGGSELREEDIPESLRHIGIIIHFYYIYIYIYILNIME